MNKHFSWLLITPLLLANNACGEYKPSVQQVEQSRVESNQQALINDVPLPVLDTSLERKNLAERLQRINAPTMTGCVYLVSYGQVVAFYPVRGKVSSLNSYLTSGEKLVRAGGQDNGAIPIEQPDLDGAYGKNADGVFFFTAETNSYVEWSGEYLFTDQCLQVNIQPQLTRQVP